MISLYLTPVALGYLTQLILAALIGGYFLLLALRREHPRHGLWLTGFFVAIAGFIATLFLEAALLPTPRLYAVFLQSPLLGAALTCLLQFAYHFPTLPASLTREARLALWLSACYTLWEAGYVLFRFAQLRAGVVEYRLDWQDILLFLFLLWAPVVLVRQMYFPTPPEKRLWARLATAWLHPPTREARALRTFTLIFLFVAGLSILNILRTFYLLSVAVANLGIAAGILVALFAFALAYLNHRPEVTSFMVKLAGVTLMVMLAIMGVAGWVIAPVYIAHYQPELPGGRALRFTPNAGGGYTITPIPFAFETDLGRDLQLDDGQQHECSEALEFAFSFYGHDYRQVYACNDGVVSLGQAVRYRAFQYRYGAGTPLLLPLLMDLDPTISPGGVFARQEPDRLIITWNRLRGFRQPEAEFTFQAVLYADGAFDFVYAALPENLVLRPNDDPGASLWAVGAFPGSLRDPGPRLTTLADLPTQSGPEGIVQDFHLAFRRHLHRLLAPLAGLILAASVFIGGGFPLMFYVSLVNPLNALLRGVRRIETGDYAVAVPVQAPDEIGFLTRAFNSLTAKVGNLIHTLEARVSARTEELNAANAHLRAEMIEREQAQIALVEQQRVLARFEERERLGRELHDGLGQVMGYINVQAQAAQTLIDTGQIDAAQSALADLIPAAQDAHTDIRAHILGLRAQETPPQDFLATVREYLAQFGQRHHIATRLSAPEPFPQAVFAPAVEEQVTRILQEALTNARKHAQAHTIEVTFSFIGDQAQMMIADDGVGFEINGKGQMANGESRITDHQSPITNHFGLQIMRERAEQVGGTLEIRSAPGKGTRLLLTVPRFLPTVEGVDGASLQDIRILLADDHPLFLDGLRTLLTARGLTVVGVAYDGCEVQEKARALRPDVVVMDINMPKCDGLTATRAIKAEFPEIKIVMLTTAEDEATLFEAIKSGASGYLLKNLDANRFCAAITGLLRDETPLAPGMAAQLLAEFARVSQTAPAPAGETAVLSPQQWDILRQVAAGVTYKEIAAIMYITEQTVKYHMSQILTRLQVENRAQAITYYRESGRP